MINTKWAIGLAVCMLWTTLFSLTNSFLVRGLRNVGILASYVVGVIMMFKIGPKKGLATWVMFGVIGGLLYTGYDILVRIRTTNPQEKQPITISHLAIGQIAWPVMGPEAIEYLLAEAGLLSNRSVTRDKEEVNQPPNQAL